MKIKLLYDDPQFVVINKPSGLLAVPGRGQNKKECVVSQIKKIFPKILDQPSVHRLDRDTSGLMVLAKTKEAHRNLSIQFQERKVEKSYLGITNGKVGKEKGEIILKFRLDPDNRPYQIYDPIQGKEGVTYWENLGHVPIEGISEEGSLIIFQPLTGRTHQLRLHSSSPLGLGHPIVGDPLYGEANPPMRLHAFSLSFFYPQLEKKKKKLIFTTNPYWKEFQLLSKEILERIEIITKQGLSERVQ